MVVHELVVLWPTLSTAVVLTVFAPAVLVLIATVPLGSLARPDCPSDAVNVAKTPLAPIGTKAGHLISRLGGVASTCTVRQPGSEPLPTLSATVPHPVCEPLVLNVCGEDSVSRFTPLPGLPSASDGS